MDENVRAFYNNFGEKLIQDFIKPNRRIHSAIEFVTGNMSLNSKNVLDIGCGIGWSSFEIGNQSAERKVHAIDLSEQLIKIAQSIFPEYSENYKVEDLTEGMTMSQKFDAVVLLDVYEHIPIEHRRGFHESLNNCLDEKFEIFLTCPTKKHQDYLRTHNPEGLQPVDEDVTLNDMQQLADDLSAHVTFFETQNIWSPEDYFHARISNFENQSKQNPVRLLHIKEKLERLNKSGLADTKKITLRQQLSYLKQKLI